MGDRSSVNLQIRIEQRAAAEKIMGRDAFHDHYPHGEECYEYEFAEVNYGTLDFLDEFVQAGIAYDSNWGAGGEYAAGTEAVRFNEEGVMLQVTVYEGGENPDMTELLARIDTPDELKKYILEHHSKTQIGPLDAEQITNGKRYQARKLIEPNN